VVVPAPWARVFDWLADVERLPEWAGEFCEGVYLARGRWMALTALGELFLAFEARPRTGEIVWRAGLSAGRLTRLVLRVEALPEGATRVVLELRGAAGGARVRLYEALRGAFPGLVARLGAGALPGAAMRAN
jgi:hypothetical protein